MSNGWQAFVSGGVVGLALSLYESVVNAAAGRRWPRALAIAILSPAVVWAIRRLAGVR